MLRARRAIGSPRRNTPAGHPGGTPRRNTPAGNQDAATRMGQIASNALFMRAAAGYITVMSLLVISGAVIRMGGRTLLNEADLTIDPGRRIGLVGRNGAGKSTLLRAIAGELAIDGGDIRLASRARHGDGAAGGAGGSGLAARHRAAGRPRTARAAGRGGDRRSAPAGRGA